MLWRYIFYSKCRDHAAYAKTDLFDSLQKHNFTDSTYVAKHATSVSQILLRHGANTEAKDNNGSTSLILTSISGHPHVVEVSCSLQIHTEWLKS